MAETLGGIEQYFEQLRLHEDCLKQLFSPTVEHVAYGDRSPSSGYGTLTSNEYEKRNINNICTSDDAVAYVDKSIADIGKQRTLERVYLALSSSRLPQKHIWLAAITGVLQDLAP